MSPDVVTVIEAPGRRLCKLRRADGTVEDYDRVRTLNFYEVEAPTLEALASLLAHLQDRWSCAVVRGEVIDPTRTRRVRRLVYPDRKTGEAPTLRDAPRSWVALDLDGLPLPAECDPHDLAACGEIARAALPPAFRNAACLIAATAGHGFKPGARLRLWAQLSRPLTGADAARWLKGQPGFDPSTLRAAQPVYTAAPRFEGMVDPLPTRLVRLDGEAVAKAPEPANLALQPRPAMPPPTVDAKGAGRYALAALTRACTAIATAPVDSRHPTAVSEAWSLARLVRAGLLGEGEVVRAVEEALVRAGKPAGEGAAIAAWAVGQRTDTGNLPAGGRS